MATDSSRLSVLHKNMKNKPKLSESIYQNSEKQSLQQTSECGIKKKGTSRYQESFAAFLLTHACPLPRMWQYYYSSSPDSHCEDPVQEGAK